jgi:hypothetical protein
MEDFSPVYDTAEIPGLDIRCALREWMHCKAQYNGDTTDSMIFVI